MLLGYAQAVPDGLRQEMPDAKQVQAALVPRRQLLRRKSLQAENGCRPPSPCGPAERKNGSRSSASGKSMRACAT